MPDRTRPPTVTCWLVAVAALSAALCPVTGTAIDPVQMDGHGRVAALVADGVPVEVRTDLRVFVKGWNRFLDLGRAQQIEYRRDGSRQTWAGRLEIEPGKFYRFEETLTQTNDVAELTLRVTADANVPIEGVFFWVFVPLDDFRGGEGQLTGPTNEIRRAALPLELTADQPRFLSGPARVVRFTAMDGRTVVTATFDRPLWTTLQDNRAWRGDDYSAHANFAAGQLATGQTATVRVRLQLTTVPDRTPVPVRVDPRRVRYRFDGFGGNYCFNIESPVTRHTLDQLQVGWARMEFNATEWEPVNDNDSPDEINWESYRDRDQPGSRLRRRLELAQELQARGVPCGVSAWHLAEWMYIDPGRGPEVHRRRIAADRWPEVVESITTYLLHLQRGYGVEPEWFSFNESDYGVRVLLSPEEHRDAIKRLGAAFAKAGLRTKLLLGDVCTARGLDYVQPTVADPAARRHVGALAFHSWSGGTPAQYAAWGDLADRLRVPLLVTEAGVDAGAWRTPWEINTFWYAWRELRQYQELLTHARPRALLRWEFTGDYPLLVRPAGGGRDERVPAPNYWPVRHLANLTPTPADALAVTAGATNILVTAFRGRGSDRRQFSVHLANFGPTRPVKLTGLPTSVTQLRAVRSGATEAFRDLGAFPVYKGEVETELPGWSLLTLTTLAEERRLPRRVP
ncbi:hypothetical protein HQ590_08420 [bacterium]|nr:hypothetical protein [bacterium]